MIIIGYNGFIRRRFCCWEQCSCDNVSSQLIKAWKTEGMNSQSHLQKYIE